MTDPTGADPNRGEIPTTDEIKDSPSVSSDAAIASTMSKISDSAVSPLRSGSIGTVTDDEHGLLTSIRKQVEKQSGMESVRDPPACTLRLREFTNEYQRVAHDQQVTVVEEEAVVLDPIGLIDNEYVEVVHTEDGTEVTLSPSYESRTVKEEARTATDPPSEDDDSANLQEGFGTFLPSDNDDEADEMREDAIKVIEQYGKEGERMLLVSLEAEAKAKAAVAQQMLAALEVEAAAIARAAEEAILRATHALEAIRGTKSSHPTHDVESNIAATIALAERDLSGESPIPQAEVDTENRERSPDIESTDSGPIPNDLSSQVTVDDGNKIPDPPIIVRRTAMPSEEHFTDPPDDVSEISCLPAPPEQDVMDQEVHTTSDFNEAVGLDAIHGADEGDENELVNQDLTLPADMDGDVDIVPANGGTPGRIAEAYVDARISLQIDTTNVVEEQEEQKMKKKIPRPTPENVMVGPGRLKQHSSASGGPAVVATTSSTGTTHKSENIGSPSTASNQDGTDDELTRSSSITSRLSATGTLETIYGRIEECRARASDPDTSPEEQMASIALMEKLESVVVSFKAIEAMDRC